jgi:hypothetical protein
MSWRFFEFCGPVLWAVSIHLDKYLVERYFKYTGVFILMIFAAAFALLVLPVLWGCFPMWLPTPARSPHPEYCMWVHYISICKR